MAKYLAQGQVLYGHLDNSDIELLTQYAQTKVRNLIVFPQTQPLPEFVLREDGPISYEPRSSRSSSSTKDTGSEQATQTSSCSRSTRRPRFKPLSPLCFLTQPFQGFSGVPRS